MAKLDGTWKMTIETPMGPQVSTVEFDTSDGLTGTVTDASSGNAAPIDNGSVDGNSFKYDVTLRIAIGEVTNNIAGEISVDGTELTGSSTNAMGSFPLTAVRA